MSEPSAIGAVNNAKAAKAMPVPGEWMFAVYQAFLGDSHPIFFLIAFQRVALICNMINDDSGSEISCMQLATMTWLVETIWKLSHIESLLSLPVSLSLLGCSLVPELS